MSISTDSADVIISKICFLIRIVVMVIHIQLVVWLTSHLPWWLT